MMKTDAAHSDKIRYRLVWNHARRLNKRGEGLVQVECQQAGRRIYFSTGIYLEPGHWEHGRVVDHELANDLNVILRRMRIDIERVELDFLKRDIRVTLPMLREAVKANTTPTAQLVDFGREVIQQSDRREVTKQSYRTLFNEIEAWRRGVRVDEVDYQFIVKYDQHLKDKQVAHNTRVGRLRLLRAVLNEAVKRDLIARNPFDRYHVEGMTNRRGFLTDDDVGRLRQLDHLNRKQRQVRDCFLFCCYTGLRFGDLRRLRTEHITQDGWIRMKMQKTGERVAIPYRELFDGRAAALLTSYGGDPCKLTRRLGDNSVVNRTLKDLLHMAGVLTTFRVTFHTSRHTFASLLLQDGVPMTTVQKLLGHKRATTTEIYAEVTDDTILSDLRRLSEPSKPQPRKRPKGKDMFHN